MHNCHLYAIITAAIIAVDALCYFGAAMDPFAGWTKPFLLALAYKGMLGALLYQGWRMGDFQKKEG